MSANDFHFKQLCPHNILASKIAELNSKNNQKANVLTKFWKKKVWW